MKAQERWKPNWKVGEEPSWLLNVQMATFQCTQGNSIYLLWHAQKTDTTKLVTSIQQGTSRQELVLGGLNDVICINEWSGISENVGGGCSGITFARNKEWLQGTLSWNRNQFFFLVSLYLHEVSENFISKSAVKYILTHPPLNSLFNRWKRTVSSCPITQQKPFALLRKNNKVFRKWLQEVSLNLRNNA